MEENRAEPFSTLRNQPRAPSRECFPACRQGRGCFKKFALRPTAQVPQFPSPSLPILQSPGLPEINHELTEAEGAQGLEAGGRWGRMGAGGADGDFQQRRGTPETHLQDGHFTRGDFYT